MRLPSCCWDWLLDWPTRNRLHTAIFVIAFTGLIEILQLWAPGRHARLGDFVVGALAASLGLAAAAAWTIRRTQRSLP
jgi:VanZ family protein